MCCPRPFRSGGGSLKWLVYLAASIASAQEEPAKSVTAVRFWSLSDVTRIAVEVTGDFEFVSDRVPSPDRLFFDLSDTRARLGKRGIYTIPVGDRLLKQIRVAEPRAGVTRVVFDLENDVDYTASQLSNPSRLIVELRSIDAKRFQAPLISGVTRAVRIGDEQPELPPAPVISAAATVQPEPVPIKVDTSKLPAPPRTTTAAARTLPVTPQDEMPVKTRTTEAATPRAAKIPKNSEGSLTRVLGLKLGRIVLDAGHGGHDTGTIGPGGLHEKDLVLDVTRRLGALIEARLGREVVYTRTDDIFIPLEDRPRLANSNKADLFLSIHANSSPQRSSSGVETYYLNFTTSKEALAVAARENASSQTPIHELKDLLQKIALKDKVDESREFAAKVQTALHTAAVKTNARARDRGVKKAPFVVLIGTQMPAILAEIGFVTNPKDEAQMKKPEHRQRLAEALYRGIAQYASTLSSFQVARN